MLNAARDTKLEYGLHHDVEKEQLRRSVEDETVEKYLQKGSIKKDGLFYIEAGTIHTSGIETLIVEI